MTNQERAKEYLGYIHYSFGDTEISTKYLMNCLDPEDEESVNEYKELIWMSLNFLDETDYMKPWDNDFNDAYCKAHNIAIKVLLIMKELIDNGTFDFVKTEEGQYKKDLHFSAELSKKIKENPDYKLTPYEAIKVIEFFKGTFYYTDYYRDDHKIISTAFAHNLKAFLNDDGNKIYRKALETLSEMIKEDGYTIEALDDNTKSVNDDTKSKKIGEYSLEDDAKFCDYINEKAEDPEFTLTPAEALKVIEVFKGVNYLGPGKAKDDLRSLVDYRIIHSKKDEKEIYKKAISVLDTIINTDGYHIESKTHRVRKTTEKTDCAIIRNKSEFIHSDFETRIRFHGEELKDLNDAYSKINEAFYDPTSPKEIVKLMEDFLSKLKDHYPDVDLIQELNFNDYQIIFCGYNTVSHDNGIQFINDKHSVIVKN